MKSDTVKSRVLEHIRVALRGGPVFGIVLLDSARSFGCAASTLDTRLRELRKAGFLSRERLLMAGGSKKRYVAYRCSAEQYNAWLAGRDTVEARGQVMREGGRATPPSPEPARVQAPGVLFDNSNTVHGVDQGGSR